jgi:hypothetical protein
VSWSAYEALAIDELWMAVEAHACHVSSYLSQFLASLQSGINPTQTT